MYVVVGGCGLKGVVDWDVAVDVDGAEKDDERGSACGSTLTTLPHRCLYVGVGFWVVLVGGGLVGGRGVWARGRKEGRLMFVFRGGSGLRTGLCRALPAVGLQGRARDVGYSGRMEVKQAGRSGGRL